MAHATSTAADREDAILRAALREFGRFGYADASVDDIARAAGVAKPTVYNRLGDKRSLFLRAWQAGSERSRERVRRAIEDAPARPDDLRAELVELGHALVECVTAEEGAAILRLQAAERSAFPELDELGERSRRSNLDQLAGKLGQYAAIGLLRLADPPRAASQFMALVTDGALPASGYGARRLARADLNDSVRAGVDTFLAAFGEPPLRS